MYRNFVIRNTWAGTSQKIEDKRIENVLNKALLSVTVSKVPSTNSDSSLPLSNQLCFIGRDLIHTSCVCYHHRDSLSHFVSASSHSNPFQSPATFLSSDSTSLHSHSSLSYNHPASYEAFSVSDHPLLHPPLHPSPLLPHRYQYHHHHHQHREHH